MAIGDFARLGRAFYVLAQEGVLSALPFPEPRPLPLRLALFFARRLERRAAKSESKAARISRALSRLGPSYIKLGQFLSTRPDVVGHALARDLSILQDNLPPFEEALARAEIVAAFGRPVEEVYTAFEPVIAAASIAEVHPAYVEDPLTGETRKVAVKILRPGVRQRFQRDLSSFYTFARLLERWVKPARRLRPRAVVDTLARSVTLEMDFRLEAAALSEMAENSRDDRDFYVPTVDWERSSKNVLTLEWIEGRKLSDIAGIAEDGHDLKRLAAVLIQTFLQHAMRDGFFHADMHQGNLFVSPAGQLVAVDFGIMGRIGPRERRFLAEILYGFIRRDYARVAQVHFEAGYVPPRHDVATFAQALRAIGEPLQGQTAADISMARLLTQLFEVTELFDMETRPELIMLQKTMVVVEGVARTLDPALDMWKTAEPVVSAWISRHLGPVGQIEQTGRTIDALIRTAADFPATVADLREAARALDAFSLREVQAKRRPHPLAPPLWIAALGLIVLNLLLLL